MTMEMLQHFMHQQHPLKLLHLGEDDGHRERTCAGCDYKLFGRVYSCDGCEFYLHELCASLPQTMQHPLHPCLNFIQFADARRHGIMLCYRCEACKFEMDIVSGQFQLINSRKEVNFFHEHPLKLSFEDADPEAKCRRCRSPILGECYACRPCGFYFHKTCAILPRKIRHFFHPCILELKVMARANCDACGKSIEMSLAYHCHMCKFTMHIQCIRFLPIRPEEEGILHVSHHHPLKLIYKDADVDYHCKGCSGPISGNTYACQSCGFYLDESCAKLPGELQHFFHPCPLFLKVMDSINCHACKDDDYGIKNMFAYHCQMCDFTMHVECTQFQPISSEDRGDWVQNWSHHHPLRLFGSQGKGWGGNLTCNVCNGGISSETGYAACEPCKFHTHKSCLDLPREIQHFSHPCLLSRGHHQIFTCDVCSTCHLLGSTYYYCKKCQFIIDVQCVLLSQEIVQRDKVEHILRYCHHHPLQLFKDPKRDNTDKVFKRTLKCLVCTNPASSLTYGCKQCGVYIHKTCLDVLPQTISMGNKSLFLMSSSEVDCDKCGRDNPSNFFFCKSQSYKQFNYWCTPCSLKKVLSIRVSPSSLVTKLHFHPCSLTLKLFSTFTCNACFTHCHTHAYYCDQCDFYVGAKCAQISKKRSSEVEKEHFCHWHPLQHLQDKKVSTAHCKVCGNFCFNSCYFCKECNFYIHKSCLEILYPMIDKHYFNWTLVLLTSLSYKCIVCQKENNSGLTFRSVEEGLKLCMECVLWPKNKLKDDGTLTSIHHWHPLELVDNLGQDVICLLCKGKGLALMYHCSQCKYYFHKACSELPFTIQHPLHQEHSLTLISNLLLPKSKRSCSLCLGNFIIDDHHSGVYHCEKCSFQLDRKCATHIPSIQYGGHPHLLTVVENMRGQGVCKICSDPCPRRNELYSQKKESYYAFRCVECNFTLHLECGPLPCNINHPCHVHLLLLEEFSVEENYTDKFVCHVCEDWRDPRLPVYRCVDGCPMICEITCVISEVIPKLLGDHGDVELRTIYPNMVSKVIPKDNDLKAKTDVLKTITSQQTMPNNRAEKSNREDEDEDEDHNMFEFSREAFIHFLSNYCTPSLDENNFLDFLTQFKIPSKVKGEYRLPKTLVPIYRELFHKYNILGEISNDDDHTVQVFILCALLHNMRMTKMVDVTTKKVREWLGLQEIFEEGTIDVSFIYEKINLICEAHFLIKAKGIVDDTSRKLHDEAMQLSRRKQDLLKQLEEIEENMEKNRKRREDHGKYVRDGMKNLRKDHANALLIKWKPVSSVFLSDYFANPVEWYEMGENKYQEKGEDKDEFESNKYQEEDEDEFEFRFDESQEEEEEDDEFEFRFDESHDEEEEDDESESDESQEEAEDEFESCESLKEEEEDNDSRRE